MTVGLTIKSAETRETETALFIPQSFESKTADTTAHSVYSVIHTPGMMRFPDSAFMYRVSQRPQASAQSPARPASGNEFSSVKSNLSFPPAPCSTVADKPLTHGVGVAVPVYHQQVIREKCGYKPREERAEGGF